MAHHKFPSLKNYELIEHTADVGIRVKGRGLSELFKKAASAMFDIISEKNPEVKIQKSKVKRISVKVKADTLDELFINWLNELLSLSATKELIFSGFQINKLDKNTLQAQATGKDVKNYRINTEIKAATYHELKIGQAEVGWQAEVIFDV